LISFEKQDDDVFSGDGIGVEDDGRSEMIKLHSMGSKRRKRGMVHRPPAVDE
jgi:hypothetical protein